MNAMSEAYPLTHATVAGPADERPMGPELSPFPDLQKNWANDPTVSAHVLTEVLPLIQHCKSWRMALEEEWRAVRRMLLLQHDEGQRYIGRSNAYVPVYARALSVLVSRLSRGLFPSDEYMDVQAKGSLDPEAGKPVKDYLQYEFEKQAKLRSVMKLFLREFFNNGLAVLKVGYLPKKLAQRKIGKLSMDKIQQMMVTPEYTDDYSCEGLRVSCRSIFSWHIYPFTVDSIDEASLIFEDLDVTRQFIEAMAAGGHWVNTDKALAGPIDSTHNTNVSERLNDMAGNSSTPMNSPVGDQNFAASKTVQEVWVRVKLPPAAYAANEDPAHPVMCKLFLCGDTILEVRRHPFWHGKFPYVVARMEALPGSFYPKGVGHLSRSLQYLVNDFTNQLNDNGTYALNPVVKVNPGVLAGPLSPMRPGAVWQMTDTQNGAVFDRPPVEQIQYGQMLVQQYAGMVQDFTGAPPAIQGIGNKGAGKTATGAQILQGNAMSPLQDLVEDLENDVLSPLMWMTWMLGQQFREDTVMAEIAGAPIKVTRDQLRGDYSFRWLASSQATNQQQRAQQAISLLSAVQPIVPLLMQLGYIVDPYPLLKRIYSDGFGFRGFDQFIKKPDPNMMQGGMLGAGQPVGPDQVQAGVGNVRSALEQVTGGGSVEMVPGEGEEFANVRDGADDMAAVLGALGGAA